MSDHTVSIPENLYAKAQDLARRTDQTVDEVIQASLAGALEHPSIDFPKDEQAELRAMTYLSDDTLWTIAREQMPTNLQGQMSRLMDKNSDGTITEDEYKTLSDLVERGQRLTLRKAQAMNLLMDRGHQIDLNDLKPTGE